MNTVNVKVIVLTGLAACLVFSGAGDVLALDVREGQYGSQERNAYSRSKENDSDRRYYVDKQTRSGWTTIDTGGSRHGIDNRDSLKGTISDKLKWRREQ